jgi:hypothetical protein
MAGLLSCEITWKDKTVRTAIWKLPGDGRRMGTS